MSYHVLKMAAVQVLFITMLAIAVPMHAQWSAEGVPVEPDGDIATWKLLPDNEGGVWVIWNMPFGLDYSTRVQHFDLDGYPSFQEGGIDVFDMVGDPSGACLGAVLDDEGNLLVAVSNYNIALAWMNYAQKISPDGELLWAPHGQLLSPNTNQYNINVGLEFACTDSANGMFVLTSKMTYPDPIHLCGINADGSMKFPENDLFIGEYDNGSSRPPQILPAHDGGAAIVWNLRNRMYGRIITAEGEYATEDSIHVIVNQDQTTTYPIFFVQDRSGGYYLITKYLWQHMDNDLNPLWPTEGVLVQGLVPSGTNTHCYSPPAILDDNSVLQTVSSNQLMYIHVNENGTILSESRATLNDTLQPVFINFGLVTNEQGTEFFTTCIYDIYNLVILGYDNDLISLWPDQYTIIISSNDVPYVGDSYTVRNSFGDVLFSVRTDIDHRGPHVYLFKIFQDGALAGRDTSNTHEQAEVSLPSTLTIQSVYPNPFNSALQVNLALPVPGLYSIQLFDISGREIYREDFMGTQGANTFHWTPENMASGVYFWRITHPSTHNFDICKTVFLR